MAVDTLYLVLNQIVYSLSEQSLLRAYYELSDHKLFQFQADFICLNLFCLRCQAVLPVEGSIIGSIHLVGTKIVRLPTRQVCHLPFLYFCVIYFNSSRSIPYNKDISFHYPTHCVCVCMCTPTCLTVHLWTAFVQSLVGVVQVYFSLTWTSWLSLLCLQETGWSVRPSLG